LVQAQFVMQIVGIDTPGWWDPSCTAVCMYVQSERCTKSVTVLTAIYRRINCAYPSCAYLAYIYTVPSPMQT
jgi:hypothetical protein